MNSPGRLVAIHQPNFFPWLPFFNKIEQCDVFVLSDDVQYPKQSWVNRVRVLVNGAPAWATLPVSSSGGSYRRIRETMIDNSRPWREKMLRSLEGNYRRALFFSEVFPIVSEVIRAPRERLVDLNVAALRAVMQLLELPTEKLVIGSSLGVEGASTELLIAIVRAVGGDAYLSGTGATAYQDEERFETEGVRLVYQRFAPAEYPQQNTAAFVPGLSVLDALFNVGPVSTRALVRSAPVPDAAATAR